MDKSLSIEPESIEGNYVKASCHHGLAELREAVRGPQPPPLKAPYNGPTAAPFEGAQKLAPIRSPPFIAEGPLP